MAGAFIFHWSGTPDPSLPKWAQNTDLYLGQYVSPGGYDTNFATTRGVPNQRSGKLTNGFAKALCRAAMIYSGCNADGYGVNQKYSMAVMTLSPKFEGDDVGIGDVASIIYEKGTGAFKTDRNGTVLDVSAFGTCPFILGMWGALTEYSDFAIKFDEFVNAADDDQKASCACWLCDWLYTNVSKGPVTVSDPPAILKASLTIRQSPAYRADLVVGSFGDKFPMTNRASGKKKPKKHSRAMDTASFVGSFSFRTEPLTPEQEERVPKIDEKYIVTEELLDMCKAIKDSTILNPSRPIRNILLIGAPGVGKSESYVGIAAGCHLPLYTFAANALTEPYDLFGQFVPVDENGEVTGEKVPIDKILDNMPTAEDIAMDSVIAYQQITGLYKEDATPTECMAAMFNLAQKSLNVNDGKQRFKFAPGQLIYALRDGGVWGFDEVTLPQNPGVVPALNPAMDSTQSITLPTGEIVHRHPDCIIVGTTNVDLEGCRNMNQAWMDRCQLIVDLPEPPDEVLIERIKSMVNWDETNPAFANIDLDRFVNAYHQLQEVAHKHRMEDGTIGPRKLADWVLATAIFGDVIKAAQMTIITGATTDKRNKAELLEKLADLF